MTEVALFANICEREKQKRTYTPLFTQPLQAMLCSGKVNSLQSDVVFSYPRLFAIRTS